MKKSRAVKIGWLSVCMLLMAGLVLAGCGNNNNNAAPSTAPSASAQSSASASAAAPTEELPFVELTYYFPNNPANMTDIEVVEEEMNRIIKSKINATIKLNAVDWGAFEQKMNVMSGAGEAYDLVFTAPWSNNYFQNVAKGALLPLDDLLDKYATSLKATVPTSVWDATRVNGKIYGAINWQIVAMPYGIAIPKQYYEKYNVDINTINKYEDLEEYLKVFKEDAPAIGYAKDSQDLFTAQPPYFGMDSIGDDTSVGWVRLNDPEMTVVNQFESEEFLGYVRMLARWNQAGYFGKDAALRTSAQNLAETKAGRNNAVWTGVPIKPGVEAETFAQSGVEIVAKPLSPALITTNRAIATMTGISSTSKNPERAMMFLELINTDKELYNLLANGIEGKHYNKVGDNLIEKVQNSGYNPNTDWMFGNQFNGYYTDPTAVGNWEKTIELNKTAQSSPLLGFAFNPEPVKTEMAQLTTVWQQYKDTLMTGTGDVEKQLVELADALKKAGAEAVVKEKQRQIDEWKSSK